MRTRLTTIQVQALTVLVMGGATRHRDDRTACTFLDAHGHDVADPTDATRPLVIATPDLTDLVTRGLVRVEHDQYRLTLRGHDYVTALALRALLA